MINKLKRLLWAFQYRKWTVTQWKKIVWSDEKKFELFNSKRRTYCRRMKLLKTYFVMKNCPKEKAHGLSLSFLLIQWFCWWAMFHNIISKHRNWNVIVCVIKIKININSTHYAAPVAPPQQQQATVYRNYFTNHTTKICLSMFWWRWNEHLCAQLQTQLFFGHVLVIQRVTGVRNNNTTSFT